MAAIISLFIVLVLSLLVVRIATAALTLTGVSHQLARFQAQSAFTGVGFTTSEAESVVSHPVRRRIISVVMLLGNAGVITAVSSLILSFVNLEQGEIPYRIVYLLVGVGLLWLIATSKWIDHQLHRLIEWALRRWTRLDILDYLDLLQLSGDYGVREMKVEEEDWVAERQLDELDLMEEGVLVLGVQREDGDYVGAPRGDTAIRAGDVLILYGRDDVLAELDERRTGLGGDAAHERAVEEQKRVEEKQEERERTRGRKKGPKKEKSEIE